DDMTPAALCQEVAKNVAAPASVRDRGLPRRPARLRRTRAAGKEAVRLCNHRLSSRRRRGGAQRDGAIPEDELDAMKERQADELRKLNDELAEERDRRQRLEEVI